MKTINAVYLSVAIGEVAIMVLLLLRIAAGPTISDRIMSCASFSPGFV